MNKGQLHEICRYFAEYAAIMLGCGATCIRIKKNIGRMAESAGLDVDMIILPAHITITICDKVDPGQSCHYSRPIAKMPVNYTINTGLSKLSWKIAEKTVSIEDSIPLFRDIISVKPFNVWTVMVLVTMANASFCGLFGGDRAAMAIVAFATAVGYSLKNILLSKQADIKMVFLCCSFISAVIGAAGYVFSISATPETALGTSVLYLIPGIPYINSVSDLIDGHYLCAFSRFVHSLILTACIALGMTAGFFLMEIKVF